MNTREIMRTLTMLATTLTTALSAQQPIIPLWSHTWPHGQDEFAAMLPVADDNHVCIDPVTGLIHVSVDAGPAGSVPFGDQVFVFSPDGEDLSPLPAPYIGNIAAGELDPLNREGTADLAAYDGTLWALRALNALGGSRTAGSVMGLRTDGSRIQMGLGGANRRGHLVADAAGPLAVRSVEIDDVGIHAMEPDGFITFTLHHSSTTFPSDACLVGGTLFTIGSGLVTPYIRSNGMTTNAWPAFIGVHPAQIAANEQHVFYAYSDGNGTCSWGARTHAGAPVWLRTEALGIVVEELQVDEFGRPWFIGNSMEEDGAPILVVTASDGSAHDTYTYGARMNDLAIANGKTYMTGQIQFAQPGTYLIGFSTDISTNSGQLISYDGIHLYPQPAADRLHLKEPVTQASIYDVSGKLVRADIQGTWVDVSQLVEGIYFLDASTMQGRRVQRFVIAR